jgi:hypothetical protein
MNDQGSRPFVHAYYSDRMGVVVSLEEEYETYATLDQSSRCIPGYRKEPDRKALFFQPFGCSPLECSSERNLGGHAIRVEVLSERSHSGGKTRGKTCFVLLDCASEGQTDTAARWILAKIGQDFTVKGNPRLFCPMFHFGVIVCLLRDVEPESRKKVAGITVGQGGQGGQTFSESERVSKCKTTTVTIKAFGQSALIPASELHYFVGLTIL